MHLQIQSHVATDLMKKEKTLINAIKGTPDIVLTEQKWGFPWEFFSKCDQIRRKLSTDLVTFTQKILMENFIFLCSVLTVYISHVTCIY